MHRFDYRFLKNEIPGSFLQTTAILYDLRARADIRKSGHPETFRALQSSALIDSVRGSNAIEGIVTSKTRLEEIVLRNHPPMTHDEHEISGYRMALDKIYSGWDTMSLTEDVIRHFHFLVLEKTSADAGKYKTEDNRIQSVDKDGKVTVRFVPVSAKKTGDACDRMLKAYHTARQDAEINGLLLTFCFVLDFLCVHPFTDGNGRVSRLLTSLLLLREGFDIGRYISIDARIKEYQAAYYDALQQSSDGWHESRNSYVPFMTFMLQILYRCYKDLDQRFFAGTSDTIPKSKRVEAVLLNAYVPLSKEEIMERLPDISMTTVERTIGSLLKAGKVKKIGTFRDARYMRGDDQGW
ncbi:MAG: Fic family protein [Lachnospiraceae bacterium]|nr:Fic family protein [Lachnospiraceae bacterium]